MSFSFLCVVKKDVKSVFETFVVLASADEADEVHDGRCLVLLRSVSNLLKFLNLYGYCNVYNVCILMLLMMMCDNDNVIDLSSVQVLTWYCMFFKHVATIMKLMMLMMLMTTLNL